MTIKGLPTTLLIHLFKEELQQLSYCADGLAVLNKSIRRDAFVRSHES